MTRVSKGTAAESIRRKLRENLAPVTLEVRNDSHKHAGHVGDDGSGETHFHIHVVSESFAGLSRLQRQRLIYDLLQAELSGPVHALSCALRTPEE